MKSIEGLIELSSIFPGGFFVYKATFDETLIHANNEVLKIFGCQNLEEFKALTGFSFKGMVYTEDYPKVAQNIKKQIRASENHLDYVEFRIKRLDGQVRYVEDFGRLISTSEGDYYIVFISDVTEKYERDKLYKDSVTNELRHRIKYDVLTDLYNKNEFIKLVSKKLNTKSEAYIVYFDIDSFSLYTNVFGISKGDSLLIYIANILTNLSKIYNFISTRLYNDKFAFYIETNLEKLETIIDTIMTFTKHYTSSYDFNLSFGIYKITNTSISVGNMLDFAEMAVETIKYRHDKKYALYSDEISKMKIEEQKYVNNMELALSNKEFCIYIQPKYNVLDDTIIGGEALVRWIQNDKIIAPSEFIPVFEHNGLITKLDLFVWEEVCKYLRYRIDNNLIVVPISVNVSRLFFTLNSFVHDITKLIDKYCIPHEYIEFEITESLFSNSILIGQKVNELRSKGFRILMDDFGSGYSNLSVLKDVEFDVLKLDLRFFESSEKRAQIIVESVIKMAQKLNIPVVAEGVENIEHVRLLKKYGCDYAQGYFYSRPIAVKEFDKLIEKAL